MRRLLAQVKTQIYVEAVDDIEDEQGEMNQYSLPAVGFTMTSYQTVPHLPHFRIIFKQHQLCSYPFQRHLQLRPAVDAIHSTGPVPSSSAPHSWVVAANWRWGATAPPPSPWIHQRPRALV